MTETIFFSEHVLSTYNLLKKGKRVLKTYIQDSDNTALIRRSPWKLGSCKQQLKESFIIEQGLRIALATTMKGEIS